MYEAMTMISPAKVNLFLAVGGVRADGYHDLVSVFQALTLADAVTLEPSDELELVSDTELGVRPDDNLAVRAAWALSQRIGMDPNVRISLAKRIPAGAGLGGGSSNAAAVIAGLARMWCVDQADPRVLDAAVSIGADVPFFLYGGTGLFLERGDHLAEVLPTPMLDVIVVWPKTPVSTAAAYEAIDADESRESAPDVDKLVTALRAGSIAEIANAMHNDFEDYSAAMVEPIADALAWLEETSGILGTVMAGSGSAVMGVCDTSTTAERLAAEAETRGWWGVATRTSSQGVRPLGEGQ